MKLSRELRLAEGCRFEMMIRIHLSTSASLVRAEHSAGTRAS